MAPGCTQNLIIPSQNITSTQEIIQIHLF
jgi:hypothetical protein